MMDCGRALLEPILAEGTRSSVATKPDLATALELKRLGFSWSVLDLGGARNMVKSAFCWIFSMSPSLRREISGWDRA
jgi:hypothetical protein